MEHNEIRHKLSEYIDGSITVGEITEIEEHLKTCTACRDALRELHKTLEHIKTVEEVDPPAWMTQKIMAKVRGAEAEQKSFLRKLFFPLSVKIPIQAVAVLFLAAGAFYIYRSTQPAYGPSEVPVKEFEAKREAAPVPAESGEKTITKGASQSAKRVPQSPEYKALDMKQEYERPAPPVPMAKLDAHAPAKPAEPAKNEKEAVLERRAAPQAAAPSMMQERAAHSAGAMPQAETKSKSITSSQKTESLSYNTGNMGAHRNLEKVILERYANGKPKLMVTYELSDSHKVKLSEERFNADGERHGIQKEYYGSGQVKAEAQYGHGKLEWYREFYPDGVKKIGKSDYDWYWLKN
ncbi:MAG: DUF2275 domain-containing protein [Betaproteobacteria bacterium]